MTNLSGFPRPEHRVHAARTRSAFTLIELLVVIAIIAILAAILFPVFAQAREKARQTACLSNTKQMALGVNMYAQDYDETLPAAEQVDYPTTSIKRNWHHLLFPYTKSAGIYVCPSDPTPNLTPASVPAGSGIEQYKNSYIANYAVLSPWNYQRTALAALQSPADTIAITEHARPGGPWPGMHCYDSSKNPATPWPPDQAVTAGGCGVRLARTRHNQGMNNVFVDGHAKWHRFEQTLTPRWMWGPDQWSITTIF